MGGGLGVGPVSLGLGTRWRCVVTFTPRPLYLREEFRYPLNSSVGGLQSRSVHLGQERNFLILPEIETWFIGSLFTIPRTLVRFHRSVCVCVCVWGKAELPNRLWMLCFFRLLMPLYYRRKLKFWLTNSGGGGGGGGGGGNLSCLNCLFPRPATASYPWGFLNYTSVLLSLIHVSLVLYIIYRFPLH